MYFRRMFLTRSDKRKTCRDSPDTPIIRAKVLIYCMNYSPEITGVGRYTGEIGDTLANAG